MLFVWKGNGWWFLIIVIVAAVLMLPLEPLLAALGDHLPLFEAAMVAGISAAVTLAVASWLERRDRKADKDLSAKDAQALHSLWWLSLTNWGYLATIAASGFFIAAALPISY